MTRDPRFPHHPVNPGCYGCDPELSSGLRLRVASPTLATVDVPATFQGAAGLAHGGFLAGVLDEAIGVAVWSLGGAYATARLETDYLRPVPIGVELVISTRILDVRGRKVRAEAEARIEGSGPVAVRASALYVRVPDEHFPTTGPSNRAGTGPGHRSSSA